MALPVTVDEAHNNFDSTVCTWSFDFASLLGIILALKYNTRVESWERFLPGTLLLVQYILLQLTFQHI